MPEKSTDILEEIPDHKLEQLLEIISKELPASIYVSQKSIQIANEVTFIRNHKRNFLEGVG